MAKSWNEFRSTDYYLNLTPEQRNEAHQQYFAEVVAPQIQANGDDVQTAYKQYMDETDVHPYYNHEVTYDQSLGQRYENNIRQLGDAWNGLTAEINKATGNEYNKQDLEQGKRFWNSQSGQADKTAAAVGASLAAPELVAAMAPEAATAAFLGEGATLGSRTLRGSEWLAENLASSEAYQMVDKGKISPTQTALDVGVSLGAQGVIEGISHSRLNPDVNQLSKVVAPVYKDMDAAERMENAVAVAEDRVHAVSQISTLSEILERAQKVNPETSASEALKAWADAAPEMHVAPIENKTKLRGQIYDRTRQTPLQQVVEVITGEKVNPSATVEEMSWLLSDLSVEDLNDIQRIADKRANRALNDIVAQQRKSNKYTGKFLDLADTQRIIEEQSEGKPWNQLFSSDINTYGADALDELGVTTATRAISGIAGRFENLSVVNKALRKDQANRIAESYGRDVKNNLKTDIESKTKKYKDAVEEFNDYSREPDINNIAKGVVLRKRADAHQYGLENLEKLSEQISLARKGNQVNVDKFTNAMYNAQLRKFVENEGESELTRAKDLKDTARQVKLMGGTAGAGSAWNQGLNLSGAGLIFMDEAIDQVGNHALGAGLAAVGSTVVGGYAAKRAIDGAINARLAEASRLLRQDRIIDKQTSEVIQKNLKSEIDDQITDWATKWHEDNPGVSHIPLDELHKEIDQVVESELKKIKALDDLPNWLKKNISIKASIATSLSNSLSSKAKSNK